MKNKASKLMLYNRNSLVKYIPDINAVYFLRGIADENSLYPVYFVGKGRKGELRRKLVGEFIDKQWNDIVYINYIQCDSEEEARRIYSEELTRHKPKYNGTTPTPQNIIHNTEYNF